jgi:hypothetical protein
MKHLTDGQIRAVVDGEVRPDEALHLKKCAECRQRLEQIQAHTQEIQHALSFLVPQKTTAGPTPRAALNQLRNRLEERKEPNMIQKLFASRILRFGLVGILLVGLLLSFPPSRAWAGQFLGLFRVQQVSVVSIDMTGFEQLNGNSALGKQISQLMSKSMNVTQQPGKPQPAASAAEASQFTGFTVRLPEKAPSAPKITVQGAAAMEFVVDRARAQALLDEAGRKDLVLPESIDGANISMTIPASARAAYGTCPDPAEVDQNDLKTQPGSMGRRYPDCLLMAEIPSPTVNTPPNIDVQQLAEIGLEFTGMSPEQAQAFTKTVDWTSSLVIPIPKNAATYKEVNVDGVTGTLIERPADDAPQFALIWVKDGIIYTIGGLGSKADLALEMANSLK